MFTILRVLLSAHKDTEWVLIKYDFLKLMQKLFQRGKLRFI